MCFSLTKKFYLWFSFWRCYFCLVLVWRIALIFVFVIKISPPHNTVCMAGDVVVRRSFQANMRGFTPRYEGIHPPKPEWANDIDDQWDDECSGRTQHWSCCCCCCQCRSNATLLLIDLRYHFIKQFVLCLLLALVQRWSDESETNVHVHSLNVNTVLTLSRNHCIQ